jgi:ribosome-binding protein aMBF1 (putative translation factor)
MQKIITPKGEALVLLPIEEYERLVDASDIAAADRVRANIAAGIDEMIPAEIVDRILSGENPVRVWRQHRGLSARDVAEKTGLSAAYISEIETGKKDGSVSAIKKIAEILHVNMDDLVSDGSGGGS